MACKLYRITTVTLERMDEAKLESVKMLAKRLACLANPQTLTIEEIPEATCGIELHCLPMDLEEEQHTPNEYRNEDLASAAHG